MVLPFLSRLRIGRIAKDRGRRETLADRVKGALKRRGKPPLQKYRTSTDRQVNLY
jgi:hypothetical protein